MRKTIIVLLVLALLIAKISTKNTTSTTTTTILTILSTSQAVAVIPPSLALQKKTEGSHPIHPLSSIAPSSQAQGLTAEKISEIFSELASPHFADEILSSHGLPTELQSYFLENYTRESAEHLLIVRIGILKSILKLDSKNWPLETRVSLQDLHLTILQNPSEHWIVKRQALRNMALVGWKSEMERNQILASLDSRALALAAYDDREFFRRALK